VFDELVGLLHVPLKLSNAEQGLLRENPEQAAELVQGQLELSLREQSVTRLIGAVERRLDSELGLAASELAEKGWEAIWETLLGSIKAEFQGRIERLIGSSGEGQIAKDVEAQLAKVDGAINEAHLLNALIAMPQGNVTTFDKRTHKRVSQRTNRLSYAYHAASFLESLSAEAVTERVLAHLKNTQKALERVWGMAALDATNGKQQESEIEALGRKALSETYRQLLLRVISELWIEYLTSMEALRISIGLEAYAQRDPLVEYKAQAYKMFQQLFADMRSSVVNRMFVFRPASPNQAAQAAQLEPPATNGGQQEAPARQPSAETAQQGAEKPRGEKRKRRRRRRK
jgi:preprotein translocase subunit SecA